MTTYVVARGGGVQKYIKDSCILLAGSGIIIGIRDRGGGEGPIHYNTNEDTGRILQNGYLCTNNGAGWFDRWLSYGCRGRSREV